MSLQTVDMQRIFLQTPEHQPVQPVRGFSDLFFRAFLPGRPARSGVRGWFFRHGAGRRRADRLVIGSAARWINLGQAGYRAGECRDALSWPIQRPILRRIFLAWRPISGRKNLDGIRAEVDRVRRAPFFVDFLRAYLTNGGAQ